MKARTFLMAAGACIWLSADADTSVSVTGVAKDEDTGRITVSYSLSGDPAIVTMDVRVRAEQEGWQTVDGAGVKRVVGDVNRTIQPSETTRTIIWMSNKEDFPLTAGEGDWQVVVRAWPLTSPPTNFNYMVVDLANNNREYYEDVSLLPELIDSDVYRKDYIVFRRIPAAGVVWRMGSPSGETGRSTADWPGERAHYVKLSHDYFMAVFETTQRQMERITGWNKATYSKFSTDRDVRPVDAMRNVCYSASYPGIRGYPDWTTSSTYDEVHAVSAGSFVALMRTRLGMGVELDLPTEAQWEFAARAGQETSLYSGCNLTATDSEDAELSRLGRYKHNGGYVDGAEPSYSCGTENGTARVGSYEPNAWGLYDMLGNVGEWCLDSIATYASSTEESPLVDPVCKADTPNHAIRGGNWQSEPKDCRVASRAWHTYYDENPSPSIGFRMCITLKDPVVVAEAVGTSGALDARPCMSAASVLDIFDSRERTRAFASLPDVFSSWLPGCLLFIR